MKLNKHLKELEKEQKELEKEQKDVQKARKRVYKILGVSDEFVPNLEALIKNNARIRDLFNELLDYQLNHKNDFKIAMLKFWGPVLGWTTFFVSSFIGYISLHEANVLSSQMKDLLQMGLSAEMVAGLLLTVPFFELGSKLSRVSAESEKMDAKMADIVDDINGVLARAIMNNAPCIQPSDNTSSI